MNAKTPGYLALEQQCSVFGALVAPFLQRYLAQWRNYKPAWTYEDGCVWKGSLDLARVTGLRQFSDFVYREASVKIAGDGSISGYAPDEFNIDNVNPGVVLLSLWQQSGEERFHRAARLHLAQLDRHPRTQSGGFWHKKIYPNQIWLDGLYMAQPLQCARARLDQDASIAADVLAQFRHVYRHLRDSNSGLLYHGWDESRAERWSDPCTGCSPNFWARALGWYVMALVDCIDQLGDGFARERAELGDFLQDVMQALLKVQASGRMWLQLPVLSDVAGNYEESSATLMIAYALMKGARLDVLDPASGAAGESALRACVDRYLDDRQLKGICGVAGLGNTPYRDGSVAYYLSEPIVANDPKGVAALMMALAEGLQRIRLL
jgi:unsaturated rhamnogalacturonyl hydrolase